MLKAKIALGVLALGITLAPAAPALAASHKPTKHHHKAKSHHKTTKTTKTTQASADGTNVICQSTDDDSAIKADITSSATAMEQGNWPAAQKDLVAFDNQENKLNNEAEAALRSAPANVQAAEHEFATQLFPMDEKIVATSTSVSQYNSAEQALFASPKWTSVSTIMENYQKSVCPTTTTSAP
jgi:hypothetical protein